MADSEVCVEHDTSISSIFFTQDRINAGDLAIQYCPTDKMTADYHSKPLQGR